MEALKYNKIVEGIEKARKALHAIKAQDYASEDVLSNFKRVSSAASELGIDVQTPYGYALFMVLMKLDRFNNIVGHGGIPANEGLEDTILDLHNYVDLAYACLVEEHND